MKLCVVTATFDERAQQFAEFARMLHRTCPPDTQVLVADGCRDARWVGGALIPYFRDAKVIRVGPEAGLMRRHLLWPVARRLRPDLLLQLDDDVEIQGTAWLSTVAALVGQDTIVGSIGVRYPTFRDLWNPGPTHVVPAPNATESVDAVSGFFLAVPSAILQDEVLGGPEALPGFRATYQPDDIDYCLRAQVHGYRSLAVGLPVRHTRGPNPDRQPMTDEDNNAWRQRVNMLFSGLKQ